MLIRTRLLTGIAVVLAVLAPVAGQQAGGPETGTPTGTAGVAATGSPSTLAEPTKKDPLRFRAQLRTQGTSAVTAQGVMQIEIERWTTDSERQSLLALVPGTATKDGQKKLLRALEGVKPRTGYVRLPNTPGWDLRYAYKSLQPDGTIQIVLATDRPTSTAANLSSAYSLDFPYTIIEMRMQPAGDKGEGKMLAQAGITAKDGRMQLQNYGNEPIALTDITAEEKKKKD